MITPVNNIAPTKNIKFTANNADLIKTIVNTAFFKLENNPKNKPRLFLGTTPKGINITISETKYGNCAKMFIQKYHRNKDTFEIIKLNRDSLDEHKVMSESGRKIRSEKRLKTILSYLTNLK